MIMIAAAGICIAVSGFVLYDAGLLGVQQVIVSSTQVQRWDTAHSIKLSVMVFEGTVNSTETKHVYEPPRTQSLEEYKKEVKEYSEWWANQTGEPLSDYDTPPDRYPILPNGDLLIEPDKHVPYNYVTVQVTEWFKDSTGQYADQVVLRDDITRAIGKIGGKPAYFEDRYAVEYPDNEKAIFFAYYTEDELVTHGAFQVFRYDENGQVYLPYFAKFKEPRVADELRAEIRANS